MKIIANRFALLKRREDQLHGPFATATSMFGRFRPDRAPSRFPPSNRKKLNSWKDCAHRSFGYFFDHWNGRTGLVQDRAGVDGSPSLGNVASTAATGFGLSAMCIAAERSWLPKEKARQHVLTTLRFLWGHAFHDHGWYYHFMDADTGERRLNSEISSIDTALLLAGILTAQGYFSSDKRNPQLGAGNF
jgi:hypothetical protein